MYDVVIKFQYALNFKDIVIILYWRGRDTARFVRNLAKSKNGHGQNGQSRQNGQDGKNGQNGQKIGQNGHRTGLARLPDYYLNI